MAIKAIKKRGKTEQYSSWLLMAFNYLPSGKLDRKTKVAMVKNILASYENRFYKDLGDPFEKSFYSNFQREIISNAPSQDVKSYLLATRDFGKGMQDNINMT